MRAILAALLALLGAGAHGAEQLPCDQSIRYTAEWFPTPELDHAKSSAQLTSIGNASKPGNAGKSGGGKAKGVQLGHVVVETKLSVLPQASCVGVVVHLAYVRPVLRVASEFPAESCAYARVLNHEHMHVLIHREIAARFRRLVYPWPEGARPAAILAHAQRELAYLMRAQEEFDSVEEYARNQTVCGGEITRLVKLPGQAGAGGKRG